MTNVTLDLRNKGSSFDATNVESFGLYAMNESTGGQLPDLLGTLQRVSTTVTNEPIFVGTNVDISGLRTLNAGASTGLVSCPTNSQTGDDDCGKQTISARKAFRTVNNFGNGLENADSMFSRASNFNEDLCLPTVLLFISFWMERIKSHHKARNVQVCTCVQPVAYESGRFGSILVIDRFLNLYTT